MLDRCEVRYWLRMRESNPKQLAIHFAGMATKRGQQAHDRLVELCKDQWSKGNRGALGDWR